MPGLSRSVAVRLSAEMASFRKEWRESGDEAQRAGEKIKAGGEKAKQAARPISELETTVARNTARLKDNRAEWDAVGTSFVRTGALIAGAGVLMVKAAMDWETAWTGVLKTVDGTPAQLAKLEDGLRGLARETGTSSTEVAAVAEAAGQLGISTGGIESFTKTVLAMAVSTNLSSEEAGTGLARLRNIMGTTEGQIANTGSAMVELGNNFATTESEILAMSLRIAGAGRQAGLSTADVLGLSAAMSSVGIEAEAGGTAVSLTLKRIGAEVETNGSKLGLFAKTAGMSVDEFRRSWGDDAAGTFTQFVAGLDNASESGSSANAVLRELGVTGIREADALLRLSGNAQGLADALADSGAEFERNEALIAESGKFYDTTAAKTRQAWESIKDSAVDAGQAMLPVVAQIADVVSGLASTFGDLPGPITGSIGAMALFGGGSLLVVGGLMKMAGAVVDFRSNLAALELSAPRAGRALGLLAKSFALVTAAAVASQALERWDQIDVEGVNQFTRGLLEASDGSDSLLNSLTTAKSTGLFGWNRNGIDGIADAFDNAADGRGKLDLSFASESSWERAGKFVEQIDAALTSAVASGDIEAASDMMAVLREQTGKSSKELEQFLPGYVEAMTGVRNEQDAAAKASGDAASEATYLTDALGRMGGSGEEAQEALAQLQQSAAEAALSFRDSMAVIDENTSLSSYITDLEAAAEAQAAWADNMVKAAARGVGADVLAKLQEEGPAAAGVLDELANGSQASIDKLNDLFGEMDSTASKMAELRAVVGGEILMEFDVKGDDDAVGKIMDVVQAKNLLPDQVETIMKALDFSSDTIAEVLAAMQNLDAQNANPNIKVNAGASFDTLRGIRAEINGITGKTVYVKVAREGGAPGGITVGGYTGMRVPEGFAGGGKVPGTAPSDPTVDNMWGVGARTGKPIRVRSGEWIVNEKQSKANDPWLSAMNGGLVMDDLMAELASSIISGAQGFASGGQVGREAITAVDFTRMKIRVRDLKRSISERERYGKGDRKSRYVLRGLDRTEAYQELRAAQYELSEQSKVQRRIPRGTSSNRYNQGRESAAQLSDDRSSARESYAGNADIQAFTSPASVSRGLTQAINDMATYTQLLIQLKKKGAAPWLLTQLQKEGPSRGAIGLARKYLSDSAALKSVNAQAAQLDAVSGIYGQVTADPKWASSKAWAGNLSSSQSRTLTNNVNVTVTSEDANQKAREISRLTKHYTDAQAMGAGI